MGVFGHSPTLGLVLSTVACLIASVASADFNVVKYGAVGDGATDDSKAFLKAWNAACSSIADDTPTLVIPKGTFRLNPVSFNGPCKSTNISVEVQGKLIAPRNPSTWERLDKSLWLGFEAVSGLSVSGSGTLDGQGSGWWKSSCRYHPGRRCTKQAPNVIKFVKCNGGHLSGLNIVNSPQTHVLVFGCVGFDIANLHIASPETSPNTDGIHLQAVQHITIKNSSIESGDDCISIGDDISDVKIDSINCGPGHGISIGSLGRDGGEASVEDVHVYNVNFKKTTNGVRIKTYQVGGGSVRGLTFKKLNFTAVENPIIIDQYYCAVAGACQKTETGVKISNVTYENAFGTSKTQVAISLNCSQVVACTGLTIDTIKLSPEDDQQKLTSNCINAHGTTNGVIQPGIPCLSP